MRWKPRCWPPMPLVAALTRDHESAQKQRERNHQGLGLILGFDWMLLEHSAGLASDIRRQIT